MTYVQRWLLAVSLFITLLLIGVLASFVLTPRTNAQPAAVTAQTATNPTLSQSSNLLSEADVTQKSPNCCLPSPLSSYKRSIIKGCWLMKSPHKPISFILMGQQATYWL